MPNYVPIHVTVAGMEGGAEEVAKWLSDITPPGDNFIVEDHFNTGMCVYTGIVTPPIVYMYKLGMCSVVLLIVSCKEWVTSLCSCLVINHDCILVFIMIYVHAPVRTEDCGLYIVEF